MRGLTGLPLDDDIIDRILVCSPNLSTLRDAILVSKSFHNVFQSHPNSIVRSVAYNEAGPALPQAIRFIRLHFLLGEAIKEDGSETEPESDDDEPKPTTAVKPLIFPEETNEISPISHKELKELSRCVTVAVRFENLFSMIHKDRSSTVSHLSTMESWRFRRAIYRLMFYAAAFPGRDFVPDDVRDSSGATREARKRQAFWSDFSTEELFEVDAVAMFFKDIVEWVQLLNGEEDIEHVVDHALNSGPSLILDCFEERELHMPVEDELTFEDVLDNDEQEVIGFLSAPLELIWQKRGKKPPEDAKRWEAILDSVDVTKEFCNQCGETYGLLLWGPENWELLNEYGLPTILTDLSILHAYAYPGILHGRLAQSPVTTEYFKKVYNAGDANTDTDGGSKDSIPRTGCNSTMLKGMFEVKTSPEYDSWNESDWLCGNCLVKFMKDHTHLWLLECRKKEGLPTLNDCWYGYGCRTQVHKKEHAEKLNHWCKPTK